MAEYALVRFSSTPSSTLGELFKLDDEGNAQFLCFTLEDQQQEKKVPGQTRIPAGRYRIKKRMDSPKFKHYDDRWAPWHKGMLWLQDVESFTWIYIHPGTVVEDTEGCILVGDGAYTNIVGKAKLFNSRDAYARIYQQMSADLERGDLYLVVKDLA